MTRSTTSTTTSPARTAAPSAPSAQAERLRALAGEQLARDRWSRDRLLAYQRERCWPGRPAPDRADAGRHQLEVQTAAMRRRIGEAWGLAPLDFYGTTEALIPAAGRPGQVVHDPDGLRVAVVLRDPGHGAKLKLVRTLVPRG